VILIDMAYRIGSTRATTIGRWSSSGCRRCNSRSIRSTFTCTFKITPNHTALAAKFAGDCTEAKPVSMKRFGRKLIAGHPQLVAPWAAVHGQHVEVVSAAGQAVADIAGTAVEGEGYRAEPPAGCTQVFSALLILGCPGAAVARCIHRIHSGGRWLGGGWGWAWQGSDTRTVWLGAGACQGLRSGARAQDVASAGASAVLSTGRALAHHTGMNGVR